MKKSVCHYSLHRTWKEKNWDCLDLAKYVKNLGVEAVDFHTRYLGSPSDAPDRIRSALAKTGLELSGLSFSNDFSQADPEKLRAQVETVIEWIGVAAKVKAPVSRIFGGSLPKEKRTDIAYRKQQLSYIIDGIGKVVRYAEKEGVVLALENHGALPGSAEDQIYVIETINSKNLRATIDVGNYLMVGQEGHEGVRKAARYCVYVHFKDFKKIPDNSSPMGYRIEPCVVGKGDVDHKKCLEELKKAGYNGYIALEYEGSENEESGVAESIAFMNKIIDANT